MPQVQASIDGQVQFIPHSITSRAGQRRHLRVDLGKFGLGQCAAGRTAGRVVGEQQLDLVQREARRFAQPDHLEAGQDGVVVAALAALSRRRRQQADLLVIAQRGRGDAGFASHLADGQRHSDLPGCLT